MANFKFGFLHLSDIHVGMSDQEWLWPNVSALILDDIEKQVARTGRCDLVIFSGDLVQRGSRDEFDQFDRILGEIWARLRASGFDPPLFTVPGNHDLTRPASSKAALIGLKNWFNLSVVRDGFFQEPRTEYREFLFADVFKEFIAWQLRPSPSSISKIGFCNGLLPGDSSAEIPLDGGTVGLVGLNSTWLQLDDEACERSLHVDFRQMMPLTDRNPTAWAASHDLNILVSHQPADWLSIESENAWLTEINPTGRFDLHLFGHMHKATANSISIGGSGSRVSIQAPSLFGLERLGDKITSRIHGYSVCQIDVKDDSRTLRIWPRTSIISLSGDRKLVPNQGFNLDDDNSVEITLGGKVGTSIAKVAPKLTELKTKRPKELEDELGNIRYNVYASEAHRAVRKPEQQLCTDLLRKGKTVWLLSSWGLASDEFIASVQRQVTSTPIETYKIDAGDYKGDVPLIDYLDKSVVKSFTGVCDQIAKKGPVFLLFDGLTSINSRSLIAQVDEFAFIIRDYCPQAYVILRTRTSPQSSKIPIVQLKPLDEAECRTYISLHEYGGREYTTIEAVARVYRYTDGIPSRIDDALRDIQIVGLTGLSPFNTDLITAESLEEELSSTLNAVVKEVASSNDYTFKRAFDLLKYLSLLPYGEQFSRIQRIEGAYGFYTNQARVLIDKVLVVTSSADKFWTQQDEFPSKVLKVPRAVRESVKSFIGKAEASAINHKLASLYFGTAWSSGVLKQAPAFRFSNPGRSTAEIINANTIILRLISEEADTIDSRALGPAVTLASLYLSALIAGMHFRSAAAFLDDLTPILPDGFEAEKASMQMRYGRCLRMIGEYHRAKGQLLDVRNGQVSKDAEQSLLVNLALCHEALDESDEARNVADEVIAINKRSSLALQAQAIKIELLGPGEERTVKLTKHEAICRKRNAHIVANNIALFLAREKGVSANAAQALLSSVMKTAQTNDDHYNGIRAVFDFCQIRADRAETFSDAEKQSLISSYHILFVERISGLFDRCHRLLWGVFENEGDIENLLVLFRQSSFIWRLHGTDAKEAEYLRKLELLVSPRLPKLHSSFPEETAYYLTRVGTKNEE